jgi:hypothetical protein
MQRGRLTMSDEAREAAWRELTEREPVRGTFARIAFGSGFDAGVAEGRRQARQAVEARDFDYNDVADMWLAVSAINALEVEG